MGERTGIEWCDSTWNPTSGCHKVSPGCKHCYAERVFPRAYAKSGRKFTDVALHPERLTQPMRWTRPRRIFVDSMSDLFHEAVPFDYVDSVFFVMSVTTRHTYQVLTKRPDWAGDQECESRYHRRFEKRRVRGEWFALTHADIMWLAGVAHICRALYGYPDFPGQAYSKEPA